MRRSSTGMAVMQRQTAVVQRQTAVVQPPLQACSPARPAAAAGLTSSRNRPAAAAGLTSSRNRPAAAAGLTSSRNRPAHGSPPPSARIVSLLGRLQGNLDLQSDPWPKISPEAKDCVQRMLEPRPDKRATADEILQHPWMRENGVATDKPLDNVILKRMTCASITCAAGRASSLPVAP